MSPSELNSQPLFFNDTLLQKHVWGYWRIASSWHIVLGPLLFWALSLRVFISSNFWFNSPLLQLDVPFDKFSLINFIANQKKKSSWHRWFLRRSSNRKNRNRKTILKWDWRCGGKHIWRPLWKTKRKIRRKKTFLTEKCPLVVSSPVCQKSSEKVHWRADHETLSK